MSIHYGDCRGMIHSQIYDCSEDLCGEMTNFLFQKSLALLVLNTSGFKQVLIVNQWLWSC